MKLNVFCIMAVMVFVSNNATAKLSVDDLLKEYEENNQLRESYIIKAETVSVLADSVSSNRPSWASYSIELRKDPNRVDMITQNWGPFPNKDKLKTVKNSKDGYKRRVIWDGDTLFEHHIGSGEFAGFVSMDNKEELKYKYTADGYYGTPLDGLFPGDLKPLSSILRSADRINLYEEMEAVNDVLCYVIEANSKNGNYVIWIDPEHGYNISRAEIRKTGDNLWYEQPLSKLPTSEDYPTPETILFTIKNVKFQEIGNVWVPVEADMKNTWTYKDGREVTVSMQHKRSDINLEPDFESVKAFVPNIPDGTRVYNEVSRITSEGIQFEWKDGKPIRKMDDAVMVVIDDMVDQLLSTDTVTLTNIKKPTEKKLPPPPEKQPSLQNQENFEKSTPPQETAVPPATSNLTVWVLILFAAVCVVAVLVFCFHKGTGNAKP